MLTTKRNALFPAFAAAAGALLFVSFSACGPSGGDDGSSPGGGYEEDEDTSAPVDSGSIDAGVDSGLPSDTSVPDDTMRGGDTSGGETGRSCEPGDCQLKEVCRDGTCVDEGALKCDGAIDKGTLELGKTVTVTGNFEGDSETDALSTTCARIDQVPEKVYKFEIPGQSSLDLQTDWPAGFDAKVEFRRGGCTSTASEDVTCRDRNEPVWFDGPTPVYMVVENDSGGTGEFIIDLTAESAPCNSGTYSCGSDGSIEYCREENGSRTPVELECAASCNGDSCKGSSCANPIGVSSSQTFTGSLGAYDASMNFSDASDCTLGSTGISPDSAGSDVVFAVDMNEGEELTVDTSGDDADNLIFVSDSCPTDVSKMSCLAGADKNSEGKDALSGWTAPSSGTYYVVVDKWSFKDGDFEYAIEIN